MNEKQKVAVPKKWERVKTSDIYQAAYLIARFAVIEKIEVIKELDKDVCVLQLSGDHIRSDQEAYINGQALIDPVFYQKAVNHIKDVVFTAIEKARKQTKRQEVSQ
jgi:hypothetical protein